MTVTMMIMIVIMIIIIMMMMIMIITRKDGWSNGTTPLDGIVDSTMTKSTIDT